MFYVTKNYFLIARQNLPLNCYRLCKFLTSIEHCTTETCYFVFVKLLYSNYIITVRIIYADLPHSLATINSTLLNLQFPSIAIVLVFGLKFFDSRVDLKI